MLPRMPTWLVMDTDNTFCCPQESEELRLPIDMQELSGAAQQARGGGSLAKAEVMLEMRAQLSTSTPWAPMVRLCSGVYPWCMPCIPHLSQLSQGWCPQEDFVC